MSDRTLSGAVTLSGHMDNMPAGKRRPKGGSWDSMAAIYHPTRKLYWQTWKHVGSMTAKQIDAELAKHARRMD